MNLGTQAIEVGQTLAGSVLSGLYVRREFTFARTHFVKTVVDVVRFDVDGVFPQMTASGTFYPSGTAPSIAGPIDWVAVSLAEYKPGFWTGLIAGKWGNTARLPHTTVTIHVPHGPLTFTARKMTLTFSGGAPDRTLELEYESPYFRTAEIEFDTVEGAHRVTGINTWSHPVHPSTLPQEQITVQKVYDRVGVDLRTTAQSAGSATLPISAAGANERWSDQELNDAMHKYWTRYRAQTQWALWMLFTGLHEESKTLAGRMFDDKDTFQRQGLAVFNDVWDDTDLVPSSYIARDAHIARMRFFAAVHESGHCFNLAHSFDKAPNQWIPLLTQNEKDNIGFMNYPHLIDLSIGNEGFFRNFRYRFSDQDIQFVRHAPEQFVEMGDAAFLTNHGFEAAETGTAGPWALSVRVNRERGVFEFLEPIHIEVTLTNISGSPLMVEEGLLENAHHLSVFIQRQGGTVRRWRPFARDCWIPKPYVVEPGASLSASRFISAGVDGWDLAEPGAYTLLVHLQSSEVEIASLPLRLRIAHPQSWDEELVAQNFFTGEVGRALAFGGTLTMAGALRALEEAVERLPNRAVARHARLALALPQMQPRKVLRLPDGEAPMSSVAADGGGIATVPARPEEARQLLEGALLGDDRQGVMDTFGPRAYRQHLERYTNWLETSGESSPAGTGAGKKSKRTPKA